MSNKGLSPGENEEFNSQYKVEKVFKADVLTCNCGLKKGSSWKTTLYFWNSAIFLFFFHFFSACCSLNFKLCRTYTLSHVSAKAYIYLLLQHKHMGFTLHLHTLIVPSHGFHVLLRGGYNRPVTLISNDLLKLNNSELSFGA